MRAKLSPLQPNERQKLYQETFRSQVHQRIDIAYPQARKIEDLVELYRDLLALLWKDELDWILQSMFFEADAIFVISSLLPDLKKINLDALATCRIGRDFFLQLDGNPDHNCVKDYLKKFFIKTLGSSEQDWKEEDTTRNPIINLLTVNIVEIIAEKPDQQLELENVLFHFAKLWQIFYSKPFSTTKGTVLLHRLTQAYKQITKANLKFDFLMVIENTDRLLNSLLPKMTEYPLNAEGGVLPYFSDNQVTTTEAYLKKKHEFFDMLQQDRIYFTDFSKIPISQLITACNLAGEPVAQAYRYEIEKRIKQPQIFSYDELSLISAQYQTLNKYKLDLRKILDKLVRENYIFF